MKLSTFVLPASLLLSFTLLPSPTSGDDMNWNSNIIRSSKFLRAQDSRRRVAGNYIVVLKDTVASATEICSELLAEYTKSANDSNNHDNNHGHAVIQNVYESAFKGFTIHIPDDELPEVRAVGGGILSKTRQQPSLLMDLMMQNDLVDYIEEDQFVTASEIQDDAGWALDRIDQGTGLDGTYAYNYTGLGVSAFVLDTGVNADHVDFEGRASCGMDFVTPDGDCADNLGHGTSVAGILGGKEHGVAKQTDLIAVKVLDDEGSGEFARVIAGINFVIEQKRQRPRESMVMNLSFGGPASAALNKAVDDATAAGIFVAAAAGNEDADACESSPASAKTALTVAATNMNDQRAEFSNWGDCVDIFSPGVNVPGPCTGSNDATCTMSGTSMATPIAAAIGAMYFEANSSLTTEQIRLFLKWYGSYGVVGDDKGSHNFLLQTKYIHDIAEGYRFMAPIRTPAPVQTSSAARRRLFFW